MVRSPDLTFLKAREIFRLRQRILHTDFWVNDVWKVKSFWLIYFETDHGGCTSLSQGATASAKAPNSPSPVDRAVCPQVLAPSTYNNSP